MLFKKLLSSCFFLSQSLNNGIYYTSRFSTYNNTNLFQNSKYFDDEYNDGSGNTLKSFFHYKKFEGFALDVNCHHGESTILLKQKYPQLQVYGIDKLQNNINICNRKKNTRSNFLKIDFENYKGIPSNAFQVVQINQYDNLMYSFLKGYNVLDEGGLLIMNAKSLDDLHEIISHIKRYQTKYYKNVIGFQIRYHVLNKTIYIFK